MTFALYPEQRIAVDSATDFFARNVLRSRKLFASPTGSGKSVIELELLRLHPESWLILPDNFGILTSMLSKLGYDVVGLTNSRIAQLGRSLRIATLTRFHNALRDGEIAPRPKQIIYDEAHHHLASTYTAIDAMLAGVPTIGFTATPYRGTPRGTTEFRAQWGEPEWVMTYAHAASRGYIAIPECQVVPLLDDDTIKVVAGEFVIQRCSVDMKSRLEAICDHIAEDWSSNTVPAVVAAPNIETARIMSDYLTTRVKSVTLLTSADDDTKSDDRETIFRRVSQAETLLVQVSIVSEGVDMPLRRLYDARPTLSPVKWLQQLGRITRPLMASERPSRYICYNRNLERHSYLLAGVLPPSVVADAQKAFDSVSSRMTVRAFGLESIGKFKQTPVRFASGMIGAICFVSFSNGNTIEQYAALIHPALELPITARKENVKGETGVAYGRWVEAPLPQDLVGFGTATQKQVSEKQFAWWQKAARSYGLDNTVEPTRREFEALPLLSNLNVRFKT